jgi:hypothetical protein
LGISFDRTKTMLKIVSSNILRGGIMKEFKILKNQFQLEKDSIVKQIENF